MKLLLFISNVSSLNQYDSSEPVYFVKVEAKGICEEIMTYKNIFGGSIYERYDQGSQIKSSSS